MARITVVGSGASAVHFCLSVLERGHEVQMVDVGHEAPEPVLPEASFQQLKHQLDDPAAYFLGEDYEGVVYPDLDAEFYGFPPSKSYVFDPVRFFEPKARGFEALSSFARGGLAQAWTGGSYPFNEAELERFPFGYDELGPFYDEVAGRIGIAGAEDDLSDFLPVHEHLQPPLRLDRHSSLLLERYEAQRGRFRNELRAHMGRARLAVLSEEREGRGACSYLGRCLWGCPSGALYTPAQTLAELQAHPHFEYLGGFHASHFELEEDAPGDGVPRIRSLVIESLADGSSRALPIESLVLAAGTLSTARIVIDSMQRQSGEPVELDGLMDNRQVLLPFVNLGLIGQRYEPDSYQYNQLSIGLETDAAEEYVHCLITTLKTAMIHPVVQNVPFDLRTSLFLFRNLHAALGLLNVNFHDTPRKGNRLAVEPGGDGGRGQLSIRYAPPSDEQRRIADAQRRLRRVLWKLGCVVPPGMAHVRPMGASVHYCGSFPMSEAPRPLTVSPNCRSHDFANLHLVDGSSFPFLPAKNLTFTLMANAARVAAREF